MMNLNRLFTATLITTFTLLQACASKPEAVPDTSPLVKSAIVTSAVRNNGFKGQFANDTVIVRKTVADMQRVDSDFKYTGSILGRVSKAQSRSEIIRLDKNLEWQLDNRSKRYRECQIDKCNERTGYQGELFAGETAQDRQDEEDALSCKLTTTKNAYSVKKTGEKREVNGFPAEEYMIDWELAYKDEAGKTARNVITINVWTTPVSGAVAEAIAMQTNFERAYFQKRTGQFPEDFIKAAPAGSLEMLLQFLLRDVDEKELNKLKALMAQATPIEGFPVSNKLQWDAINETCAAPPEETEEEEDELNTSSLKGLLASVGKQVVKQEIEKKKEEKIREIAMKPWLSVVEDVKSIEITDIRESQLTVPSNYKLDNRS